MASIIHEFKHQVEKTPDQLLYAFLNLHGKISQSYTYREFLDRTTDIASHLQRSYKLNEGDRVLLVYPPGLEMICAFFACARIGVIPVPVYPPTDTGFQSALYKMTFIAKDCEASAVLTDRTYYWSMKLNLARTKLKKFSFKTDWVSKLPWIITSDVRNTDVDNDFVEKHSEILFLQYTSGSTNNPKGVMVTHQNVISNCNMVVDHTPIGVSWLPQYHDMGLIGYYLFFALKGGTTYGFSPLDFIQRPALWFETITRYKVTASSAPNFAFAYCLKPGKIPEATFKNLNLSSLRFLMTAAEPVRTDTYCEFIRTFEPHGLQAKSFFSAYGLAEFTLAVSNYGKTVTSFETDSLKQNIAKQTIADNSTTSLLSCGKPLGDTEIRIVDTSGMPREVSDGRVGEIWINGSSKCIGYWNRPELSRETFEATGEGTLHGISWLRTGDLGFLHDGELYICGRTKDLIIIRGANYYPQDIEYIVENNSAIRKGCVAAFAVNSTDQESLVIVAELSNAKVIPNGTEINNEIFKLTGVEASQIIFVKARTIPKTSSGKLMRHKVKSLYEENKLDVVFKAINPGITNSEIDSDVTAEPHLPADELNLLFKQYGMKGNHSMTIADMDLDSIKLAELTQNIKNYLESKGHIDLSRQISVNLIHRVNVAELEEVLRGLGAASIPAKLRFKQVFKKLQEEHTYREQHMMKDDVSLFSVTVPKDNINFHSVAGDIFLTGGTGFFGPFLLKSLLEQNNETIHVLVRAEDEKAGLERLREAFALTGFDNNFQLEFNKRVRPVCGDLSLPKLGLSEQHWNELSNNIAVIYHNGAQVNYLFDYETMRDSNVIGTNTILKLALQGKRKVLNHISTTFIFGWSVKDTLYEHDLNESMHALDFGYSQSKWVSEQLVNNAIKQGLPGRIFRPALISPEITGAGYNFDISIRLLAFMLKHGIGTNAQNQVSFMPADVASDNIVAISNIPESIGKTFHVTRDKYATMGDVTNILSSITGIDFTNYSLYDFVPEVVQRCGPNDLLFPLLNFLVHSVDNIQGMEFKRYDNSNYQYYRNQSPHGRQDPSLEDVVLGIHRFMKRQGIAETSYVKNHYA